MLTPDIYDPTLNPLYRDVLAHYGVIALPCRVRDPDRKGKVEASIGHAQKTPLKGLRFETLIGAQAYLDRWETRWADTRIHGTTKRQVAAMFAEERPALGPLPLEPFRYYRHGVRTVHLDGCVEVEAAYYSAPPGWIGQRVQVWDGARVRLLAPTTGVLLREHLRSPRGWHGIHDANRPARTPRATLTLLARATRAGPGIGTICEHIHQHDGAVGIRRILGVPTYRFLRRYLDRRPAAPLSLRQVDPLIRQTHPLPRSHRSQDWRHVMNFVELDRALRQLRLSGMADVLEARLRHAQTERLAPLDFLSALVLRLKTCSLLSTRDAPCSGSRQWAN